MDKESINYARIDAGIRDLIFLLNEIPFVATRSCCEGHLYDVSREDIHPDAGHKFLYSGDLFFRVDPKYPLAKAFMVDVNDLQIQYLFVSLSEHHCGDLACREEGTHVLSLGCCDLTQSRHITDEDSFVQRLKKRYQVPVDIGERRIAEYKKVWADLLHIAAKYVNRTLPL